eukprot:m.356322 g.356322  ORF g.356322 m.356322 type:complete len:294 (+) comp17504_c0_seq1:139-1020(+)
MIYPITLIPSVSWPFDLASINNTMPADPEVLARMSTVKHIILVLSGKGGVGKSTVASQLAVGLLSKGNKVGVLDIDLCGPSLPRMFGVQNANIHNCDEGWVPVYLHEQRLAIMSIAFLLEHEDDAVVWRGPKKTAMIKQMLTDVRWGELDYLIIDTPPGTSDEHLTIVKALAGVNPDGAVLVTTPQGVALADVRREASFCKKAKLPILGVVENMSGFVCPHCEECYNLFSTGGGERLATEIGSPFLGRVPIDPGFGDAVGQGKSFQDEETSGQTRTAIKTVLENVLAQVPQTP